MGRSIANAVVAAALCLALPLAAHAAGLGKLTVLSPLGQPLNAEIDVVALQAGEEDGLTARLASPEAFKQAGIEFNGILLGVRFSVERRGERSFIKLTTAQPVNEPFVELLVELQWSSGRLVREYTFLLDPAEYKGPAAIAAVPAAKAPAVAEAPKPEASKAEEPKAEQPKPEEAKAEPAKPEEPKPAAEAKPEEAKPEGAKPEAGSIEAKPLEPAPSAEAKPAPEARPAEPGTMYEVKKGDTLGAIARQHLAPGVNLDQMLIAIYRANQEAFIRNNINLVRAGRILNIPPAEGAGSLDPEDAKRLVRSHHADFNAYRSRLAATPMPAEATPGQREVAGTIQPKPAAVPPEKQDQLKLSRADPQKPAAAAAARAAREDDLAARGRALKESQSRVTDLEKNATDLQKLLELKNQQLAELEKKAAAKPVPAAPVPAPKPAAEAPKPAAEAPKPAAPAPKPEAPKPAAEAPKPAAEPPKPAAEAPKPAPAAEAPKPAAEAPKPAAETPTPKPAAEAPKPAAKAPEKPAAKAAPEPSVIDEFLDNPTALGSLAAVVVLLFGYGAWAWRRKKRSQAKFQDSVLDAASGAGASSVFGSPSSSGAASGAPGVSQGGSASQAPAGMEAEEVDPIAEADVYMAYGRDAQAEEILKEALAKDASRTAVHAKLLEIYANRKDAKSFEQNALKLKSLTNGAGPEWDKAAALGRSIDPQNGLYGGGGGGGAARAAAPAAAAAAAAAAAPTLDFDLGGATGSGATDISLDGGAPKEAGGAMDFDLGAAAAAPAGDQQTDFTPEGTLIMDQKSAGDTTGGLDFDLGLGGGAKPAAPAAPARAAAADTSGGLDFDLNLDTGGGDKPTQPAPSMDLSAISLDLGGDTPASGGGGSDPKWQEVATKLDLAKAYEEMGDKDGARELLNEVMKDGDGAQKGQAQQLLAKLG